VKAVFDTNILVYAIFWKGAPYRCLLAAQAGLVKLVASEPVLAEFRRVLIETFHLAPGQVEEALAMVRETATLVEIAGGLPPGTYSLTLICKVDGYTLADKVDGAAELTVTSGDFFGTGKVTSPDSGPFLVKHRWELISCDDATKTVAPCRC